MLINQWKKHQEDGIVYKLFEQQKYQALGDTGGYLPRVLVLLSNIKAKKKKNIISQTLFLFFFYF